MIPNKLAERVEPDMLKVRPAHPTALEAIMPPRFNMRPVPTITVKVNNAGQAEGLGLATEKGFIKVGVYE